jgi:TonB-dependent SusC/RagA subfamily outer membrane receptor
MQNNQQANILHRWYASAGRSLCGFLLALLLPALSISLYAQTPRTVSGTVKDTSGEPLIGVSVVVAGSSSGTVTDANGCYRIGIPEGKTSLRFSYVGFEIQDVETGSGSTIDIILKEDTKTLGEVVVVGYGTMRKSDITGSVSSVKPEELRKIPSSRTDEALQGQIAGVQVISNDASPNTRLSIRIRGVNSITAVSEPLIIIDGMQGGNLSDVHPGDIESLEVLKDASATAIYGSRGAGGVILVTTKKVAQASRRLPTMDSLQFSS